MTQWRYSHPEGVHSGLTGIDWMRWPLERYVKCLESESALNISMDEAYQHVPTTAQVEQRGMSTDDEKWALRWHGLQLLRDVDNGDNPG